jgi:hypothetical protein
MMQDDSLESQNEEEYNPPQKSYDFDVPVSPMYDESGKVEPIPAAAGPSPEYGTFVVQPIRETTDFLTDDAVPGTTKPEKESGRKVVEEDDLD